MEGTQKSQVYVSTVLPVPIDVVWQTIRDFNALPAWHPLIESSQIEGGLSGDCVGATRSFTLNDGARIRERLLALSDVDRFCTYQIVEAPIQVEDYVATIRLRPITDGNQTFAEWFATFHALPETRAETVGLVKNIFTVGFSGLNKSLRG